MLLQIVMPNGLELPVKNELKRKGFEKLNVRDGHIELEASLDEMYDLNMSLRCADRVFIVLKRFKARSFEELFEGVNDFNWEEWMDEDARFLINGRSKNSKLFSVSNCQSIAEKAIVERLKKEYKKDWFDKTGSRFKILVDILDDEVSLLLDSSGEGLHKRGYRLKTVEAPLRETMAASLIELSYWNPKRNFYDPFCGSGTIAIEVAMMACNIAPGIYRNYDCEYWKNSNKEIIEEVRNRLKEVVNKDLDIKIIASDINELAIETAINNAKLLDLDSVITFENNAFPSGKVTNDDCGVLIANPPYGERLEDLDTVEELYCEMGEWMKMMDKWSFYILTSHKFFEKLIDKKASRKRKLYNGKIQVNYYQFYGPRPE